MSDPEVDCVEVDCSEALARLERFLDGALEADTVEALSEHLTACAPCGDRAEFERHVRVLIRTRLEEGISPPPGLVDRIRGCLDDAARAD